MINLGLLRIGSNIVWLLWRGVRYGEVSAMERCPLWRGVRYGEVSAMEGCPLYGCPLYGDIIEYIIENIIENI